jgi:hypothetical protein
MAKSILAIYSGNDYQARVFWLQACQAMFSDSKIEKVGYEIDDVKSFDDVAVIYKSPILSERNEPISADYWQVKYHVDASGDLTYQKLTEPGFINAASKSILQRLHQAQLELAPDGVGARFYFVSPWHIKAGDPLAKLVCNNGGEIRLDVLFSNSAPMRRVREAWKTHLELPCDKELEHALRPFRIHVGYPPLQQLRDNVNAHLISAGLTPTDMNTASNPYDDLIRKLRGSGKAWFSRDEIEEICKREKLWRGKEGNGEKVLRLGIRSFMRWAENMENETHRMINLVPYFDGRTVRSTNLWMDNIYSELDNFVQGSLKERVFYTLRLDCHLSIAFGAGYFIGTKSGFTVAPIQKSFSGQAIWKVGDSQPTTPDLWIFSDNKINEAGDIVLAISITHDIADDVQDYVARCLPGVSRIIVCQPKSGVGGNAIPNGEHAYCLINQLVGWIKQNRSVRERQVTLHVFSAAPNGFMFFLGQQAKALGTIQLYEHNFDNPSQNEYQPSLKFPKG